MSDLPTGPLTEIERRVLWLSAPIVHYANRVRAHPSSLKAATCR